MKKTFIPLVALALMVGAPIAHAEKGPSEDRAKVEVKAEIEDKGVFDKVRSLLRDKVEEKKLEIESEREDIQKEAVERRVKVLEARKEVKAEARNIGIQKSVEKTTAMLNAMVERFEKLMDRISSRISKINERGGDTKISSEKLAQAKTDLAKARAQIEDLKKIDLSLGSTTASTTASTTLKANFDAYKKAVKAVKDTFKLVHKDLEESVRALKLGEVKVSATTTATTTSQ
jgi:hypothetical protein